jgi:Aldo/keto reductase family.
MGKLGYDFLDGNAETIASTALRFTYSVPGVHTMIVGTKSPGRWKTNAQLLAKGPLSESEMEIYANSGNRQPKQTGSDRSKPHASSLTDEQLEEHRLGFIRILQLAYSGERAAARAYAGHWRSLKTARSARQSNVSKRRKWNIVRPWARCSSLCRLNPLSGVNV